MLVLCTVSRTQIFSGTSRPVDVQFQIAYACSSCRPGSQIASPGLAPPARSRVSDGHERNSARATFQLIARPSCHMHVQLHIRPPAVAHACGAIGKSRALEREAAGNLVVLSGECGPWLVSPLALVSPSKRKPYRRPTNGDHPRHDDERQRVLARQVAQW